MNEVEFWKAVGEELQRRRLRKGLRSTNQIRKFGGPTYKTADRIELGDVGHLDSLRLYLKAVDLSIVDLFRAILIPKKREWSPELEEIIRRFEIVTVEGRAAILGTARAVPEREPIRETPDGLQDGSAGTHDAGGGSRTRRGRK